jgi:hypothetical protein
MVSVLVLALPGAGACSSATVAGGHAGLDSGDAPEGATGSGGMEAGPMGLPDVEAGPTQGDGGVDGADGASPMDSAAVMDAADAADADGGCFVSSVGVYGQCLTTAACAALGSYTSTPGYCPGPASIECCTVTPNVADNPPVPAGWVLMQQSAVTPAMTTWAVAILQNPTTYPMFSTAMQTFGTLDVLARVEWHPPDFQNSTVHRGVTLYQPQ